MSENDLIFDRTQSTVGKTDFGLINVILLRGGAGFLGLGGSSKVRNALWPNLGNSTFLSFSGYLLGRVHRALNTPLRRP